MTHLKEIKISYTTMKLIVDIYLETKSISCISRIIRKKGLKINHLNRRILLILIF